MLSKTTARPLCCISFGVAADGLITAPNAAEVARRIDYVMVAAPKAGGCGHPVSIEIVGNAPIDDMWGSDHYGLVADLRY